MRSIFTLVITTLAIFSLFAQSAVSIKINHLLDGKPFVFNELSVDDLGNGFKISRLEYYLSGFEVIHDGGQVTPINDLYVLVDLSSKVSQTTVELGDLNVSNIEAINFMMGVDELTNHDDPAAWPSDHPLAPKFPSMHWGWNAGYRFIALEGQCGFNVEQEMQFHLIGDEFHMPISFPVTMTGESAYVLNLDAEYNHLMKGIDLSSGVIIHGGTGVIKDLATNLQMNVFAQSVSTSLDDDISVSEFSVFPNPSSNGLLNFSIQGNKSTANLTIVNAMGQMVYSAKVDNYIQATISQSGLYIAQLIDKNGEILATKKVIID